MDVSLQKKAFSDEDLKKLREDFPILKQMVNEKPLVYFDNANTSQRPNMVVEAMVDYYQNYNANVHRSVHALGDKATFMYEDSRRKVQQFINAKSNLECVFVRGATEGINLVATSFLMPRIQRGEEIIISEMEHHSNIVPWQMVARHTGANLRIIPMNHYGELDLEVYQQLLKSGKACFVAVNHISNALGTINPVKLMTKMAHDAGCPILIDGCQAGPHANIDVQDIECDFYVFSGHKMYGPTGIGVLYAPYEILDEMAPYQFGGEMITFVSFEQTDFQEPPYRFEAGTPNIAGVIGLGAAIDYIASIDKTRMIQTENHLLEYARNAMHQVPGLAIIGQAADKASIMSFNIQGIHHQDVSTILSSMGIAVRSGHHCAMPAMAHFEIDGSCRASFAFYNTQNEVDYFVNCLYDIKKIFGHE